MDSETRTHTFRSLDSEAQYLKGIGPKLALILEKAGIKTVRDALFYLPRRYEDRSHLPPISDVRPGQWLTVRGRIIDLDSRSTRGGMVVLKATISDRTGDLKLVWFNQPWVTKKLRGYDGEVIAYGYVKDVHFDMEMHSPEFEILDNETDPEQFARITPVYPLVDGVSQNIVRKAVASALDNYLDFVKDPIPDGFLKRHKLKPIKWCLSQIHRPTTDENRLEARKRLVFEEFLCSQIVLALRRADTQAEVGISFPISKLHDDTPNLVDQIKQMLSFDLTGAQKRVIREVWADMERPFPMNRLVQGDVGSGKTAVAACAMLAAVRCGYQAAMMAPTEILAEQHYNTLHKLLEPLGISVTLMVGKHTSKQKQAARNKVAIGEIDIAIGTHALVQEGVEFKKLGLVIIDEQHRFGVMQRAALRQKGIGNPDVLVMTATPIPRTLTMAIFGDLDLSVIDEMPPGRRPIKTHWKQPFERAGVYQGARKLVEEGRQVYFVCPMVSESEKMLAQAAEELELRLKTQVFPDLRIGLLHGQLKAKEKEIVMEQFRRHELDILVSTTVIEVGVDVPNASVMVVEDANRFGLSQLHQLRGRVGRGAHQSYCLMIADAKSDDARERMDAMVGTTDGFKIAEIDLRLRGPGELCGTKQSGTLDFKIADLVQDGYLMEKARQAAMELVAEDPNLRQYTELVTLAKERFGEKAVVAIS
jgi:ATP-dependent DNA helicase RecG